MHGTGWMLVDWSLVLRNRISIKLHDGRQVQVKALGGQLQCVSCRWLRWVHMDTFRLSSCCTWFSWCNQHSSHDHYFLSIVLLVVSLPIPKINKKKGRGLVRKRTFMSNFPDVFFHLKIAPHHQLLPGLRWCVATCISTNDLPGGQSAPVMKCCFFPNGLLSNRKWSECRVLESMCYYNTVSCHIYFNIDTCSIMPMPLLEGPDSVLIAFCWSKEFSSKVKDVLPGWCSRVPRDQTDCPLVWLPWRRKSLSQLYSGWKTLRCYLLGP